MEIKLVALGAKDRLRGCVESVHALLEEAAGEQRWEIAEPPGQNVVSLRHHGGETELRVTLEPDGNHTLVSCQAGSANVKPGFEAHRDALVRSLREKVTKSRRSPP